MKEVMVVYEPEKIIGKSVKVFLTDGGKFPFRVNECGRDYISGFDDEGTDLHIKLADIDFVVA